MRTTVTFLLGIVIGAGALWLIVAMPGSLTTYHLIRNNDDSTFVRLVEQEGCEPFTTRDILVVRCPRFRLR